MTRAPRPGTGTSRETRRAILGVRVDDMTWDEVLSLLDTYYRSRAPHQVMTPNPEFVMYALRDPEFRALLGRADLAPADGIGLKWAGALLGQPIRDIVPGSEIVERIAPRAAGRGERWFLLGAQPGVAAEAGAVLEQRYPGLVIAGTWSGAPGPEHDAEICARIEAVMPVDVLLVAYGAPGQDLWIARNQPRLCIPIAIGVGGTFNLLAGKSPRPPRIVKRLQLIWLFRLVTQPWRWRRQLALISFVLRVVRAMVGRYITGTRSM
jgi:N-acetylglucosaminyldiphosphoundecaprenol N-acetyl-beta-D-mannosaminyltransferase